jgi:hypothetical protein
MKSRLAWLLGIALSLAGCTTPLAPLELETGPDAQLTPDGLARVEWMQPGTIAYMRPDAELGSYDSVMLALTSITYKRPPRRDGGIGRNNFPLTPAQRDMFERIFHDAFERELQRSGERKLVKEAGPNVLRIDARIADLVVATPPPQETLGSSYYVRSSGSLVLVLELLDSESGEVLARIFQSSAGTAGAQDPAYLDTPANSQSKLREMFSGIAARLAERLDSFREAAEAAEASPASTPQ